MSEPEQSYLITLGLEVPWCSVRRGKKSGESQEHPDAPSNDSILALGPLPIPCRGCVLQHHPQGRQRRRLAANRCIPRCRRRESEREKALLASLPCPLCCFPFNYQAGICEAEWWEQTRDAHSHFSPYSGQRNDVSVGQPRTRGMCLPGCSSRCCFHLQHSQIWSFVCLFLQPQAPAGLPLPQLVLPLPAARCHDQESPARSQALGLLPATTHIVQLQHLPSAFADNLCFVFLLSPFFTSI